MKPALRRQLPAAISMVIITILVIAGIFGGLYFFYISGRLTDTNESEGASSQINNAITESPNVEAQVVIVHVGNIAQVQAFDIAIHLLDQQQTDNNTFTNTVLITRLSDQSVIGELTFSELGRPENIDALTIRTLHTTATSAQFAVQTAQDLQGQTAPDPNY